MGEFAQRIPAGESDYILWADLKGFKTRRREAAAPGPADYRSYLQRRTPGTLDCI